MGQEIATKKLSFVSFELKNNTYVGSLSLDAAMIEHGNLETVLQRATKVYSHSIYKMSTLIEQIAEMRNHRKRVPARKIWELGDHIFKLKKDLERLSLQLDGLYAHLVRDLQVKKKWLEKVVIFRRYIHKKTLIPKSLNWGRCEKGTKRVAVALQKGIYRV